MVCVMGVDEISGVELSLVGFGCECDGRETEEAGGRGLIWAGGEGARLPGSTITFGAKVSALRGLESERQTDHKKISGNELALAEHQL